MLVPSSKIMECRVRVAGSDPSFAHTSLTGFDPLLPFSFDGSCQSTPWLTGAGARSAEGTDIGHENAEGMAYVGVRVEPTVRLGTEVEGGSRHESFDWDLRRTA